MYCQCMHTGTNPMYRRAYYLKQFNNTKKKHLRKTELPFYDSYAGKNPLEKPIREGTHFKTHRGLNWIMDQNATYC